MRPVSEAIAAWADGQPCVIHVGLGGAGHDVKMVHDDIEYGDMQLICEACAMLRAAGFPTHEMADIFEGCNEGDPQSYLILIAAKALRQRDPETGQPVVDLILDKAGQKGAGQRTFISAAETAAVVSRIRAAVEAGVLSSMKDARVAASERLLGPTPMQEPRRTELAKRLHDAVYAARIASYGQGLDLMLAPFFECVRNRSQQAWREPVAMAVSRGVTVPALSASLA